MFGLYTAPTYDSKNLDNNSKLYINGYDKSLIYPTFVEKVNYYDVVNAT